MPASQAVPARRILADLCVALLLAAGIGIATGAASMGLVCFIAAIAG